MLAQLIQEFPIAPVSTKGLRDDAMVCRVLRTCRMSKVASNEFAAANARENRSLGLALRIKTAMRKRFEMVLFVISNSSPASSMPTPALRFCRRPEAMAETILD